MRLLLLLIIVSLFTFCTEKYSPTADTTNALLDLIIQQSTNEGIEFTNLYDTLTAVIADDKNETLKLVERLKTKGFKVTDWGRGNHTLGPRMVSISMVNNNCRCEITKYYYHTVDTTLYQITERIRCEKITSNKLKSIHQTSNSN